MRLTIFISLIFFLSNCSKPKTVLICGDHVCLNKAEAEQYFDKKKLIKSKEKKKEKLLFKKKTITNKDVNKKRNDLVDVCTILEKCSIDEISKYLLEQGKRKKFPNLTTRQ